MGLLATALLATKIGDPKEITLNSDFIRTDEDSSYTRPAYWKKIDDLSLTRFSIQIIYQSGMPERFRLPYLNSTEFSELREWLQSKTSHYNIAFSRKPWWKLF